MVGGFIWALVFFKVHPIAEQQLPLLWCWVGVAIYGLPPLMVAKATAAYLQKREYIVCMVRAATFLAALELKHRVSWPMKAAQQGADAASAAGASGAGDVPVAFHILMASCVPFLLSSCIFLRVRFPFHLAIQTLAVAKLLMGEGRLCAAAVQQCPASDCHQSMVIAAESISQYSGAFPVPHALVGFRPDHACPLLLAFLQLVLGLCVPSFFLYVTERYSREVFLASTEAEQGARPYPPHDPLDLNLIIFSLALLPPLVSLLWIVLELAELWGIGPAGWAAGIGG
ncbi:hypothetical protein N2152v2_004946 [Parachlorella kessleri]